MTLEDVFVSLGAPVLGDTRVWGAFHVATVFVIMSIVGRLSSSFKASFCKNLFIFAVSPLEKVVSVARVHLRSPFA